MHGLETSKGMGGDTQPISIDFAEEGGAWKEVRADKPIISVIIPAHNVERYIGSCLDSVLAQEAPAIEILAIDDGSTDRTPMILNEYARQDSRVRTFGQNWQGPSVARNRAIGLARGAYLCFVDSDDLLSPRALVALHNAALEHRADVVVGAHRRFMDGVPTCAEVCSPRLRPGRVCTGRDALLNYVKGNLQGSVWASLFRRSLFKDVRFAPGRWHADARIWTGILRNTERLVTIRDEVYQYRQRAGSIMHCLSPQMLDSFVTARHISEVVSECFRSTRLRIAARSRGVRIAVTLLLRVHALGGDIAKWRRHIRGHVSRSAAAYFVLHPYTPGRVRVFAFLYLFGPRFIFSVHPKLRAVWRLLTLRPRPLPSVRVDVGRSPCSNESLRNGLVEVAAHSDRSFADH